jgi:hypothetical protein
MKTIKIILIGLATIIITLLLFAWYIGFFNPVNVIEKYEGGYVVAGMNVTGSYSKVGNSIMEVDNKLKKMGVTSSKAFGIYYDNPKVMADEKCRSFVGNILEEQDLSRVDDLKSAGFRVDSVPYAKTIIAEFPMKNSISYMIGPMKIYPKISKYMEKRGYEVLLSIEIYDAAHEKIIYMMQY